MRNGGIITDSRRSRGENSDCSAFTNTPLLQRLLERIRSDWSAFTLLLAQALALAAAKIKNKVKQQKLQEVTPTQMLAAQERR